MGMCGSGEDDKQGVLPVWCVSVDLTDVSVDT